MSAINTTYKDSTLKVVTWDFLVGVRWYDIPTTTSLECYRELQRRSLKLLGSDKALVVSYSDASAERLDFESGSRALVEAVMADGKASLHGMAQIIAGDGFGAASVRSVISGIQLAVRPDYPVKLFGDSKSARPWIEDILLQVDRTDLIREGAVSLLLKELEPGLT